MIRHFWEILAEMSNADRVAVVGFICATSRIPRSADDFARPLQIQAPSGGNQDSRLPTSRTCFNLLEYVTCATRGSAESVIACLGHRITASISWAKW